MTKRECEVKAKDRRGVSSEAGDLWVTWEGG